MQIISPRKLYLYSNNIQKIQGISNLYNLSTLWLNNNMIREIEGISKLVSLTDLNLAANKISHIGKVGGADFIKFEILIFLDMDKMNFG